MNLSIPTSLKPEKKMVLNQIAMDDSGKRLVIEFTDPWSQKDYLVEVDATTVRSQERPSLYPPQQIVDSGQKPHEPRQGISDAEIKKLKLENAGMSVKIIDLERKLKRLTDDAARRIKKKIINTIEAWTYDEHGNVTNYTEFRADALENEMSVDIPVGNAVITINGEEIDA